MDTLALELFALNIRIEALEMIYHSKASHIGSCFSVADILAALYGRCLNINPLFPKHSSRDRCILSKGHAAAALYAALALRGFFNKSELKDFCSEKSIYTGHVHHLVKGVEYSSGSLGHGLSVGCGMALASQKKKTHQVVVIASDGEMNEGSFWEGVMFAAHHKLTSLVLIIDYNQMQSLGLCASILDLKKIDQKFLAFGWDVAIIDGHSIDEISKAFQEPSKNPKVIIAKTIKGKGVSFMENELLWHYRNPCETLYRKAKQELECARDLLIS